MYPERLHASRLVGNQFWPCSIAGAVLAKRLPWRLTIAAYPAILDSRAVCILSAPACLCIRTSSCRGKHYGRSSGL
eukprot:6198905-Pleurochrysis_carterae.AAC.1